MLFTKKTNIILFIYKTRPSYKDITKEKQEKMIHGVKDKKNKDHNERGENIYLQKWLKK